jgi:aminoglycoside phosphotransferase (APT) family kinase protein
MALLDFRRPECNHDLEELYQQSGHTRGMTRLHPDEVAIDGIVVCRLVRTQLPELAGLPMKPVRPQGTDNIDYRLGSELSMRLPRKLSAVPSLLIERDWLPQLAPSLPLAVPVSVAAGEPDELYPFPWAVCTWVSGDGWSSRSWGARERGLSLSSSRRSTPARLPKDRSCGRPAGRATRRL